jgi:hypothetical protein
MIGKREKFLLSLSPCLFSLSPKKRPKGVFNVAEKIKPEIIAVITAAIQEVSKCGKVVAVKVKRNENWTLANRVK